MGADEWVEYLLTTLWGVLFGLVGGLVHLIRRGAHGWWHVFSQLVAGGFCGWLLYALLDGFNGVPPGWVAASCGVAGSSGGIVLDVLLAVMVNRLRKLGGDNGGEDETGETEEDGAP